MRPLPIFIGWDARETVAVAVLSHSIVRRASRPVSIIPIARHHLAGLHDRPRGPLDSTDFSVTRFLVPALSGYQGRSIFMDCDMLCLGDVAELVDHVARAPRRAVHVVQHDYVPKSDRKFLGQRQTAYPRKNWSSVMVFENSFCRALTPEYVNSATGLDLHRFAWCPDAMIGDLPKAWNHLVGEYPPSADAQLLHYTRGGPWFRETEACDHAAEWFAEYADLRGHGPAMAQF